MTPVNHIQCLKTGSVVSSIAICNSQKLNEEFVVSSGAKGSNWLMF